MVLLVTAEELASHMQRDDLDLASAQQAIAGASSFVESVTGLAFTTRTATIRLPAHAGLTMTLPLRPVRAVASVTIGGTAYTDSTLTAEGTLWRAAGWRTTYAPQVVELTVTYGMAATPDDIKAVVFELAEDTYELSKGVEVESIDDHRIQYTGELSEQSQKTLTAYGAGAATVGIGRR